MDFVQIFWDSYKLIMLHHNSDLTHLKLSLSKKEYWNSGHFEYQRFCEFVCVVGRYGFVQPWILSFQVLKVAMLCCPQFTFSIFLSEKVPTTYGRYCCMLVVFSTKLTPNYLGTRKLLHCMYKILFWFIKKFCHCILDFQNDAVPVVCNIYWM